MNPQDYISSFSFDWRLAPYDIQGSIAHVKMLARCKIISSSDSKKIISGLESIQKNLSLGKKLPKAEDIHFAIENELVRRIGETGKRMHTARSRNDQVVLALKLYVRDMAERIVHEIKESQTAILNCAMKNQKTLMPGFTHLQHGQPIFFAHHILACAWMLQRDKERFSDMLKRLDESPIGACAMAGTAFPIDRHYTANLLGFSRVSENSIDTVSDRDFVIEFVFDCAMTMVHLSRLAEDLIVWSSAEFDFVTLDTKLTSGSSIMPQKRNPDTIELLRGKSSRTIGDLVQLLTLLKGLPLSYNRDLQEDKPPLFDAAETTILSLSLTSDIFKTIKINKEKMEQSCRRGFLLATELADYLARKGVPFRKAHSIVSKMIEDFRQGPECYEDLQNLSLNELKSYSSKFDVDVYKLLSPLRNAEEKNSYGGTGVRAMSRQIHQLKALLKKS